MNQSPIHPLVVALPRACHYLEGSYPARDREGTTLMYEIVVQGRIDAHWRRWLNGMIVAFQAESGRTTLIVRLPDQAALRGLLDKLWDLNMTLISVNPQPEEV